jgi:hypothetical protein
MHLALFVFVVALGFIAAVGRSYGTRDDHCEQKRGQTSLFLAQEQAVGSK